MPPPTHIVQYIGQQVDKYCTLYCTTFGCSGIEVLGGPFTMNIVGLGDIRFECQALPREASTKDSFEPHAVICQTPEQFLLL